ncbi:13105_t:CDS:2 [Funneliformis mosseae]|uniref:13105_t:CDS:1 n=1 Tax=Funneliformis mosseae TaxID=27381 RepID=A0A9N9C6T1_FUNMO|nr:13105_t:CDS:2 [Funneliformis mosseae]
MSIKLINGTSGALEKLAAVSYYTLHLEDTPYPEDIPYLEDISRSYQENILLNKDNSQILYFPLNKNTSQTPFSSLNRNRSQTLSSLLNRNRSQTLYSYQEQEEKKNIGVLMKKIIKETKVEKEIKKKKERCQRGFQHMVKNKDQMLINLQPLISWNNWIEGLERVIGNLGYNLDEVSESDIEKV